MWFQFYDAVSTQRASGKLFVPIVVPDVTLTVCGVRTLHKLLRQGGDCFACWRLIVEFDWSICHHHICTLLVYWWVHHVSLGELTAASRKVGKPD